MGLGSRGINSQGRPQPKTGKNSHLDMPKHMYQKSLSTDRGKQILPCICDKRVI